jgi:hypothetical protein
MLETIQEEGSNFAPIGRKFGESIANKKIELMHMLETLPLTHSKASPNCTVSAPSGVHAVASSCYVDILTAVPVLENFQYQEKTISITPIAERTYLDGIKWKQAVLPYSRVMTKTGSNSFFQVPRNLDNHCLGNGLETECLVCFQPTTIHEIHDACLIAINDDKDPGEKCTMVSIEGVTDSIVEIEPNKWNFVDTDPGNLLERCDENEGVLMPLPYSGQLTLNPQCKYQLINGPEVNNHPFLLAVDFIQSKVTDKLDNKRTFKEDINTLQQHFRSYGYIYILVTCSVVALVMLAYFTVCCLRLKRIRNRRQAQNRRTAAVRFVTSDSEETASPLIEFLSRTPRLLPLRYNNPTVVV